MTISISSLTFPLLALMASNNHQANGFSSVQVPTATHQWMSSRLAMSDDSSDATLLSLSLEKPLGMVLEEVVEDAPNGVFVLELGEDGSAAASPEKDAILGSRLISVMGEDVTTIMFDDVMDKIINAPSPVDVVLSTTTPTASSSSEADSEAEVEAIKGPTGYAMGDPVTVTVQREGEIDLVINSKAGANLRKTLMENEVEVYRGFKAKISNCGGQGQCGFCAVEFIESEGWAPRSDYESKNGKIKNNPNIRLSCMNNLQAPVTIKM